MSTIAPPKVPCIGCCMPVDVGVPRCQDCRAGRVPVVLEEPSSVEEWTLEGDLICSHGGTEPFRNTWSSDRHDDPEAEARRYAATTRNAFADLVLSHQTVIRSLRVQRPL